MPTYGLGGCGFLGIGLEQLTPPVQSALATATTGGTIAAGTYRYIVTAINANGETTKSNEQTIVTTGSISTVTVTWAAVTGATGYKLYKTAAGGATNTELLYKTVGLVITDIDTAPGSPSGAFPSTNSASNPGVYAVPTKYIPIQSESMKYMQSTTFRRSIRQSVDVTGVAAGNAHTEGDLSIEVTADSAVYLHKITRAGLVKTGAGPFTYKFSNSACGATAPMTASLTVVRNGIVFGYIGCVVSQAKYSLDNGTMVASYSIVGTDELVQTIPTATWPSTQPFGNGDIAIEIPTGTAVFDSDNFDFTINDNAEPMFRARNTGLGAQFIKFGERSSELSLTRDFFSRADYDAFKVLTGQSITVSAARGAETMTFLMPAMIKDSYEVTLSGQGDLVVGTIAYQGTLDGTGKSYEITLVTTENI